LALIVLVVGTGPAIADFFLLGVPPNGGTASTAYGVSADGSVVVGVGFTPDQVAFRWTRATGMQPLGFLPGGSASLAQAASADGSVVVGWSTSTSGMQAFRWAEGGGMQPLGFLPGGVFSISTGVSADGGVVVGQGGNPTQAFRWTATGGMQGLGFSLGGNFSSATEVSADGGVVVGVANDAANSYRPFLWTGGGMTILTDPNGVFSGGSAEGVSADGSVVVGEGSSPLGPQAFRWTAAGGMVGLGDLPGGSFFSRALATSADGSVVVGGSITDSPGQVEAFVWDGGHGMRRLTDVLAGQGDVLDGWVLREATGISVDGATIVGWGVHSGREEGWVATISPIPEPVGLAGVVAAGLILAARRRRRTSG
jgi:probable HAF family extracellular repeat protein